VVLWVEVQPQPRHGASGGAGSGSFPFFPPACWRTTTELRCSHRVDNMITSTSCVHLGSRASERRAPRAHPFANQRVLGVSRAFPALAYYKQPKCFHALSRLSRSRNFVANSSAFACMHQTETHGFSICVMARRRYTRLVAEIASDCICDRAI
jgi:hypothetical protein